MPASQEEQSGVITSVSTYERADTFRQAAAEVSGIIVVNVLDPAVPEQADLFAEAYADKELEGPMRGLSSAIGEYTAPRTPDQIKNDVVEPALRAGRVLVMIEHGKQGLAEFWERAAAISAQ